jgi:hypothetical protein
MATVKITGAPLTIEDRLAVANGARVELAEEAPATIADGRAVVDPGPRLPGTPSTASRPRSARQGQQAGNRSFGRLSPV